MVRTWYGKEYATFTKVKYVKGKYSFCVIKVFKVTDLDVFERMIDKSTASLWLRQRKGEHCWLPLYRAIQDPKVVVDKEAKLALKPKPSHGAAELSMWGLVVMAYADGATATVPSVAEGFKADFNAKHFVLELRQKKNSDQFDATLKPREAPLSTARPLAKSVWMSLLEKGNSFGDNEALKWLLEDDTNRAETPPDDLFSGDRDNEIRDHIIDHDYVRETEGRLSTVIKEHLDQLQQCRKQIRDRLQRKSESSPSQESKEAERIFTKLLNDLKRLGFLLSSLVKGEKIGQADALRLTKRCVPTPLRRWRKWIDYDKLQQRHVVIEALVKVLSLPNRVHEKLSTKSKPLATVQLKGLFEPDVAPLLKRQIKFAPRRVLSNIESNMDGKTEVQIIVKPNSTPAEL